MKTVLSTIDNTWYNVTVTVSSSLFWSTEIVDTSIDSGNYGYQLSKGNNCTSLVKKIAGGLLIDYFEPVQPK
jgi:hypothetical protein